MMFQLYVLVRHGLKTIWIQVALLCKGFAWREKIGFMDEPVYKRLNDMEVHDLEVMWIKVMPKKTPRKLSCILVACLYYTPKTEYLKIRDHLITKIDTVMRKHPECGVIITGDFNQLRGNFMKTHYRFVQVVNVVTRGQAILDKIWTNMEEVYTPSVTISELGVIGP